MKDGNSHDSFSCTSFIPFLGIVEGFPFTDITHPECGLYVMNCSAKPPTINLKEGRSFDVINIFFNRTIVIRDKVRQHQLESKNCDSLKNEFLLPPVSPSISFTLTSPNLTLIKCLRRHPHTNLPLGSISVEYNTYEGCDDDDYVMYYRYPNQLKWSELPPSHIPYCSLVQLPLIQPPPPPWMSNPFDLLSAEFSLEWNVKEDCDNKCHKHRVKRKVAIGAGAAVGGVILALSVYGSLAPKRFKYKDIKNMTNSFKEKLGQGGYGSVFK